MEPAELMARVAMVQAQVACAMLRLAAMSAENRNRELAGQSPAYDETAFLAVIDEEGIHTNAVVGLLRY